MVATWFRQQQVRRATVIVGGVTVAYLAGCAERMQADGSVNAVADLVVGRRYLLVPSVLVVLVASGLAGSVAAWNDWANGRVAGAVAGACGAALWAAGTIVAVGLTAAGTVAAFGNGPPDDPMPWGSLLGFVVRVGLTSFGFALFAGAMGLLRPRRSSPAIVVPVGMAAVELALWVTTSGAAGEGLLGGGTLALLVGGAGQARAMHLGPSALAWCQGLVWLVVPALGVALVARGPHRPGSTGAAECEHGLPRSRS
jgi:hypothetical protein